MANLVSDALIGVGALARELSFLNFELIQRLLVHVRLSVQVDGKLLNVGNDLAIGCHLDLVGLDAELGQLVLHTDQLIRQSVIGLRLVLNDLRALVLALGQRFLQLLCLLGGLHTDLL